ncbi:9867_t:CDS:2 [Ambispora gerdemannii]|uniref:9867_t:CDS:1 n=1 Tax=Ambispora gerdemannii TaxID=144530 RepID=A0A9N9DDU0_9GLOM|nr:9867_t:CDS:2 [Ambispora gerdemannii]
MLNNGNILLNIRQVKFARKSSAHNWFAVQFTEPEFNSDGKPITETIAEIEPSGLAQSRSQLQVLTIKKRLDNTQDIVPSGCFSSNMAEFKAN